MTKAAEKYLSLHPLCFTFDLYSELKDMGNKKDYLGKLLLCMEKTIAADGYEIFIYDKKSTDYYLAAKTSLKVIRKDVLKHILTHTNIRYRIGEGMTGRVIKDGKSWNVPFLPDVPPELRQWKVFALKDPSSWLTVPIKSEGGLVLAVMRFSREPFIRFIMGLSIWHLVRFIPRWLNRKKVFSLHEQIAIESLAMISSTSIKKFI